MAPAIEKLKADSIAELERIRRKFADDPEAAHGESVPVLLKFLTEDGHADLVDAYHKANAGFWHA